MSLESLALLLSVVPKVLIAMGAATVVALAAIYAIAALISGFSGFGFSENRCPNPNGTYFGCFGIQR